MLGAIRTWAVKELGGVKRAPVASSILLLGGLGLGWWIAGQFDENPFTRSTYSNLTNAELRQRTKDAVTALRTFNERYLSQRNSANLAEFDQEFQTHLPEIRSLASELERRVKLPPNTDPIMDLSRNRPGPSSARGRWLVLGRSIPWRTIWINSPTASLHREV